MCQPGRPATEGRVPLRPGRLVGLRLPEHEVAGVLLVVLVGVHPRPRLHPRHVEAGQTAVLGEGGDAEVDAAVGRVGVAPGDEPLDEGDHLRDVLGGAGDDLGLLQPQGRHVLPEGGDPGGGEGREVLARGLRLLDDPVVHVRDVHDLPHLPSLVPEGAAQ